MTPSQRWRIALVGGYLLLATATISAIALYARHVNNQVGVPYTAAASNIVRAQHEVAMLRYAIADFLRDPTPRLQRRIQRILDNIENHAETARNSFKRLQLSDAAQAEALTSLESVFDELPRLRALTADALTELERRDQFRTLATEVENTLAFVYSTLHRLNHEAAAKRQDMVQTLSATVIGLGMLLLVIVAALLGSIHKMLGQRETLERLTVTDILTGLPNRRALLQSAQRMLVRQPPDEQPISLALLDVDHFKRVNDRAGHPQGDRVLKEIGRRLAAFVRSGDTVARLGGEEFGLLMPDTDAAGAQALAERIREDIEQHFSGLMADGDQLTISVGVATSHNSEAVQFDTLYARADEALYEAKRAGRNRVVVDA